MRNLKKILAMVLALVMSLSLMATAGASQFPDVDDSNPYKTAIDVLDELKVFQGFEDGTFKPTDKLNRAQAAVLVYRIATGDVENKYLDNYTYMQQSKFTDLEGYNWAKGYINYCQNAKIVVGTSATTFDPGDPVTGYQLLVMVLRTLGYGAAGEFSDPNGWELETAKIAEREGILKHVTTGDFGAPAQRQMVAEILFRGLLHDTVEYSPLTPGGYTNSGVSLGKRELGLEDISGVVMANEWADLDDGSVLAENKTRLDVNGKEYNLDVSSALTDVGELRHAYVQNGTKVLTSLEDAGGNNVKDSKDLERRGEGITVTKLRGDIKVDDDTEYFVNFGENVQKESEWRIEFNVEFVDNTHVTPNITKAGAKEAFEKEFGDLDDAGMKQVDSDPYKYTKSIKAGNEITEDDLSIIEGIFAMADGEDTTNDAEAGINHGVIGSVYAGANSQSSANRNKNLAVEMTYSRFVREYINGGNVDVKESDNGEWLKVIDNDGDGVAEYVFLTQFVMTTITDWNTKTEKWTFEYENDVKNGDIKLVEGTSELAIGDVILYTWIDGVCHVSKPEPVEMTVAKKGIDYKNQTLTGTDETVYDWSGIDHKAESLYDDVSYAVAGVTYDLYQDWFGFTRLYKESDGGLVLLTDGYFATDRRNDEFKAEIWNGEFVDVDVVGGADDFISDAVNNEAGNVTIGGFASNNDDEGTWKRLYRFNATYYNGTGFSEHTGDPKIQAAGDIPADADHYSYRTNIASYIVNADGAYSLSLARDHRENARTHYNSFAIDVTNYEVKAKNQVLWGIETVDVNGKIDDVQRINTTTETVYYLVESNGKDVEVTTWTGYNNAPSNYTVERAYAVTSYVADKATWKNTLPYEVAEVVVIEATKDTGVPNAYLAVNLEQRMFGNQQIGLNGLGYHPDTESWGLDTEIMKPSSKQVSLLSATADWPNGNDDMMNFYYVDNDGEAVLIDEGFGSYNIYAGRVVTYDSVKNRNYIQVTKDGSDDATQANSYFFPKDLETAYTVTYNYRDTSVRTKYNAGYTDKFAIGSDSDEPDSKGDKVIYMVDGDGNVGFVVNVTNSTYVDASGDTYTVPGLGELWTAIYTDANGAAAAVAAPTVEFYGVRATEDTTTPISFKEATDGVEADKAKISIEAAGGNTISLVQIDGIENKSCIASDKKSATIAVDADAGEPKEETVVLIVTVTNGSAQTAYTYTLTVKGQVDNKDNLEVTASAGPINVWVSDVANDSIEIGVTGMRTIQNVIDALNVVYAADNLERGETQGDDAGTVAYAGESALTDIVNIGDTIALTITNNDGRDYEITAIVREATAAEAADAAIAAAKQALEDAIEDGISIVLDDQSATPNEAGIKNAIAAEVQGIVGAPATSGVTIEAADVEITGAAQTAALADDIAALEVGKDATISFTVAIQDTDGTGTSVSVDGTATLVYYLNDDGAKAAVAEVITGIDDWAFADYGTEALFKAALVAELEAVPGVQAGSVEITIVDGYPSSAGDVKFTYSFKYGPDATVDPIEVNEANSTITLV